MNRRQKVAISIVFACVVAAAVAVLILSFNRAPALQASGAIEGATVTNSENPHKQAPVSNVLITAAAAGYTTSTRSQISGHFRLPLAREWKAQQAITITFRADHFQPLQQTLVPNGELMVARLIPNDNKQADPQTGERTALTDVRVRYSTEFITTSNVGSIAPTMDVPNKGNEPCDPDGPCSPDKQWRATISTKTLDAGKDNQYVNTRVSCIAGPCPFTQLEDDNYTRPARVINIRVRNWSDTTTFLIEAEVSRTQRSNFVREAYPAIFGQAMTFTLPPGAQGLYLQAELNRHPIVFPVGPALQLSWATCNVETPSDGSKLFRCELKPGYFFDAGQAAPVRSP